LTNRNGRHSGSEDQIQAKYTMAITVMITGVPAHRIRKFENFGLCKPARTDSRQRLFSDSDIETIRQISLLESDGVNLAGIRVILSMKNGSTRLDLEL
jgi:MerR family transcriptional regulator, heat shock protein HspR